MDACSRKHSFPLNETILFAYMAKSDGAQKRAINQSSWTSTYTIPHVGTCYILKPDKRLLTSDDELSVFFSVNTPIKSHSIYLLDPYFFLTKQENSIIPFLLLDNPMSKSIPLHTIYTSRRNRAEFSCNSDQSYNYNQCVSNNLARKIGCKNPFDGSTQAGNFRSCNTTEELVAHGNANFAIYSADKKQTSKPNCMSIALPLQPLLYCWNTTKV